MCIRDRIVAEEEAAKGQLQERFRKIAEEAARVAARKIGEAEAERQMETWAAEEAAMEAQLAAERAEADALMAALKAAGGDAKPKPPSLEQFLRARGGDETGPLRFPRLVPLPPARRALLRQRLRRAALRLLRGGRGVLLLALLLEGL